VLVLACVADGTRDTWFGALLSVRKSSCVVAVTEVGISSILVRSSESATVVSRDAERASISRIRTSRGIVDSIVLQSGVESEVDNAVEFAEYCLFGWSLLVGRPLD
jgi:hypothetical protein